MNESLVEKLNRMEKEIALLKSKPIPKPVNYQEGIYILEEANKNLDRILGDLNKKYGLLEGELKLLNSKKPVDYGEDIKSLNKQIAALKNKKPVKQIDYSEDIKSLKKSNDKLEINISELKDKNTELNKKLSVLQNKKPVKQVDYKKDIESLNKNNNALKLDLSNLNDKNIELNKSISALKNKKPIDYSVDISRLEKELTALNSKKPVKQIDYKEDISRLNCRIDPLVKSINEIKNKPVKPLVAEKIKTVDHSNELAKINIEITSIRKSVSNKKDINIKEEIKNTVNRKYINELYRNK